MNNKLYVVGIGPGSKDNMSFACYEAIKSSEILVGYTAYIDLVRQHFPEKEYFTSAMTKEIDRCNKALELAASGKIVSVLCSGDAGVYGMASLIYELSKNFAKVDIEVIPGITAALAGASCLGAPLSHDFVILSLSDLLTPIDLIIKRLRCAGEADFCIALYNPGSKKRKDYLKKACDILLEYKSPDTVCGLVSKIDRSGEKYQITTLYELKDIEVDMFTTVFIGNASTKIIEGKMVTPRGYRLD